MQNRYNRKAHPMIEIANEKSGRAFELGKKLEETLKKKYAAIRKEDWYTAAKNKSEEIELKIELEGLFNKGK